MEIFHILSRHLEEDEVCQVSEVDEHEEDALFFTELISCPDEWEEEEWYRCCRHKYDIHIWCIEKRQWRHYRGESEYHEEIHDIWSHDISDGDISISPASCDDRGRELWSARTDGDDRETDNRLRESEHFREVYSTCHEELPTEEEDSDTSDDPEGCLRSWVDNLDFLALIWGEVMMLQWVERIRYRHQKEYDTIDTTYHIPSCSVEESITHEEEKYEARQDDDREIEKSSIFREDYRWYDGCDTEYEKYIGNIGTEHIPYRDLSVSPDTRHDGDNELWHTRANSDDRETDDSFWDTVFFRDRDSTIDEGITSECEEYESCDDKKEWHEYFHKRELRIIFGIVLIFVWKQ